MEDPTHCSDCGRDLDEVGCGTCETCDVKHVTDEVPA